MAQAPTEQRQWIMVVPGKLAVRFAVAVLLPSVSQRGPRDRPVVGESPARSGAPVRGDCWATNMSVGWAQGVLFVGWARSR